MSYALSALTVLAWMLAGWAFALSANAYLVLGVPLVALYQVIGRRKPLQALWRFDGTPLVWGWRGALVTAVAAALPAWLLVSELLHWRSAPVDPAVALWYACATIGAAGLGWALTHWRTAATTGRSSTPLMATIVVVGVIFFIVNGVSRGQHLPGSPMTALLRFAVDAVLYADVCFLLEEVAFRGAFDVAVADDAGITGVRAWISAAFVSALWGLWHLPLFVHGAADVPAAVQVMVFHIALGIPLSFLARQSGSIAPTVLVHALIDAWRNLWG